MKCDIIYKPVESSKTVVRQTVEDVTLQRALGQIVANHPLGKIIAVMDWEAYQALHQDHGLVGAL